MKFPLALQPFTIREELSKDYFGALEKVARLGYKGIELGPPPEGITLDEQKRRLDELGLEVIGTHAGLDKLTNNLDSVIGFLKEVGGKYITLSLGFKTKQDVLDSASQFNRIGEQCRKQGCQFLYHNHDWEFVKFDGEYAYDILLRETDPALVQMELDTYWVKKGGEDPVEYMRKLNQRCPLLHIKDVEAGEEQFFAEIGEGVLDFQAIAAAAEEIGTEWLVVEQDQSRRPIFESLELSYQNLVKMNLIENG